MEKLTAREKEVAILLTKGLTNNEIAEELSLSFHTVKAHLESIYDKLDMHSRLLVAVFIKDEIDNL